MKIFKIKNRAQIPVGFLIGLAFFSFSFLYLFSYEYIPKEMKGCRFRNLLHYPCPSCGGTRAGYFLLQGKIKNSFMENPLIFSTGIFLFFFAFISLYSYLKNYQIKFTLSKKEIIFLRILIISLFFLNWIYLILKEVI